MLHPSICRQTNRRPVRQSQSNQLPFSLASKMVAGQMRNSSRLGKVSKGKGRAWIATYCNFNTIARPGYTLVPKKNATINILSTAKKKEKELKKQEAAAKIAAKKEAAAKATAANGAAAPVKEKAKKEKAVAAVEEVPFVNNTPPGEKKGRSCDLIY